jgi:hypothetical protein
MRREVVLSVVFRGCKPQLSKAQHTLAQHKKNRVIVLAAGRSHFGTPLRRASQRKTLLPVGNMMTTESKLIPVRNS